VTTTRERARRTPCPSATGLTSCVSAGCTGSRHCPFHADAGRGAASFSIARAASGSTRAVPVAPGAIGSPPTSIAACAAVASSTR